MLNPAVARVNLSSGGVVIRYECSLAIDEACFSFTAERLNLISEETDQIVFW